MLHENNELIIDLWSRLKAHIPAKERLEVADLIVSVFDEYGLADGLETEIGLDKELKAAVHSYYGYSAEEDEDDSSEY
jgi:hypothetical protein